MPHTWLPKVTFISVVPAREVGFSSMIKLSEVSPWWRAQAQVYAQAGGTLGPASKRQIVENVLYLVA
jgi:hypothetical protein